MRHQQAFKSALQLGLRRLHASGSALLAEKDLGAGGSVGSSFLSWLPGARSHLINTPLSQPLPGLNQIEPFKAPGQPLATEITVLPNGARIISEASPGPTASIGIYVNSGSIYEKKGTHGCSALLECLSFKATKHRSSSRIMEEVEQAGSTLMAMASREQMSYTMDCLKTTLPATLEILCDSVLNPAFDPQEVEEQKQRLAMLMEAGEKDISMLNEQLVVKAYKGALANPLLPDADALACINADTLREFCRTNYCGGRLVLAAAGVDHKQLVDMAAPMLSTAPTGIVPPEPESQYQGAYVNAPHHDTKPHCDIIAAWEYQGGWRNVPGAVAMTVLTYLMGGGDSFSSGGPGKGMHSRLYTRVLNHYQWVHSCSAFNATFNGSGLVGIRATCDPDYARSMLDVMCTEMEAVARHVSGVELARAKRTALSTIVNALESKATSAEDIGRQFLTYGHRISGREYAEMIEAVTHTDIQSFAQSLLQTKPSLLTHGKGSEQIDYNMILQRYGWAADSSVFNNQRHGKQSLKESAEERFRKMFNGWRS